MVERKVLSLVSWLVDWKVGEMVAMACWMAGARVASSVDELAADSAILLEAWLRSDEKGTYDYLVIIRNLHHITFVVDSMAVQ